jgi:hypothetical protein
MKKIAFVIAFLGLGLVAAQAQNAPKKEIKKTETLAPAGSNAVVDAPAEVNANDAAVTEAKSSEKKASCTPEEKKSCGSASGKKSCCSKKAEAKKETPVNP